MSNYYGVSQSDHGHQYRWIFESDKIHDRLGGEPDTSEDILFPIGGSNSSSTFFTPLNDDIDVIRFLLSPGEIDKEDPTLCEIGEYALTLGGGTGLDDCTQHFLDKYGIYDDAIINRSDDADRHRAKVLQMTEDLKNAGYMEFDSENPFYGKDRHMRFSDLEAIYENIAMEHVKYRQTDPMKKSHHKKR